MMTKAQRAKSGFNDAHNNATGQYEIAIADGLSALGEAVIEMQAEQHRMEQDLANRR